MAAKIEMGRQRQQQDEGEGEGDGRGSGGAAKTVKVNHSAPAPAARSPKSGDLGGEGGRRGGRLYHSSIPILSIQKDSEKNEWSLYRRHILTT